jgi:hypothetical protein
MKPPVCTHFVTIGCGVAALVASAPARSDDVGENSGFVDCQTVPVLLLSPEPVEGYAVEKYWAEKEPPTAEFDARIKVGGEDVPWNSYRVRIEYLIDSLGCTFEERVVESSGYEAIDRIAMTYIENARYAATEDNAQSRPIRTWTYQFVNVFPPALGEWHGEFGETTFALDRVDISLSRTQDGSSCEFHLGASSSAPESSNSRVLSVMLTMPCLPVAALVGRRFETAVSGAPHSVLLDSDFVGTASDGWYATRWKSPGDGVPTLDISFDACDSEFVSGTVSAVLELVRLRDQLPSEPRRVTLTGRFRARYE